MPTSFQSFSPGDLIEDTHVEQFIEPIQNLEAGKSWYGGSATGTANAFAVTLDPAPASYTAGMIVHFKANNTVSGASTLNLNSLGNKALVKEGNTSLVSGDIVSGQLVAAMYDGTQFQLVSPVLNPTVTTSPPTQNVLAYAEATPKQDYVQTNITLPSFVFDNAKSYLMEVSVMPATGTPNVRITLNDGTTSYAFPGSSTYITGKGYYGSHEVAVKLPTLSGSHTITVNANYIGYVQVKIWEIYDNLVYADFTPSFGGSISSASLDSFTATSGHRYLMTMTAMSISSGGYAAASCYLDNGVVTTGIPQSGPTSQEVEAGYYDGTISVSRVLTGLSGSYSVTVRGKNSPAITVRIYDIT